MASQHIIRLFPSMGLRRRYLSHVPLHTYQRRTLHRTLRRGGIESGEFHSISGSAICKRAYSRCNHL